MSRKTLVIDVELLDSLDPTKFAVVLTKELQSKTKKKTHEHQISTGCPACRSRITLEIRVHPPREEIAELMLVKAETEEFLPSVGKVGIHKISPDVKPAEMLVAKQEVLEEDDYAADQYEVSFEGTGDDVEVYENVEMLDEVKDAIVPGVFQAGTQPKWKKTSKRRTWASNPVAEQRFECDVCNKEYRSRAGIEGHLLGRHFRHELNVCCEMCGQKFRLPCQRDDHIKRKHSERSRSHTCKVCSSRFYDKTMLKAHMISHNPKQMYQCEVCAKLFVRMKNLQAHTVMHFPSERFHCSHCGKVFNRKSNLRNHERIHENKRPYACTYPNCLKRFNDASTRAQHVMSHIKKDRGLCGMSYAEVRKFYYKRPRFEWEPEEENAGDVTAMHFEIQMATEAIEGNEDVKVDEQKKEIV